MEFAREPSFNRSQLFTMVALVMLGLGLFGLVVRAGMSEKSTAQQCDRIVDATDRTSCVQAFRGELSPRPAKGALAPDWKAVQGQR